MMVRRNSAKLRSCKAAGSFSCEKWGSFELLTHIEADPAIGSFSEFSYETELSAYDAANFTDLAAYLVRHEAGLFVLCAAPQIAHWSTPALQAWRRLDCALAKKAWWLLSVELSKLRREPAWTNALQLSRCAQFEVDARDEARVLEHLCHVGSASIGDVMKHCKATRDSFETILKLLSSGILICDDDDTLTPGSRVRAGRPTPPTNSIAWLSTGAVCLSSLWRNA